MIKLADICPRNRALFMTSQAPRSLALIGLATRVPHQADKPGIRRTTTVTDVSPMIWPPNALAG